MTTANEISDPEEIKQAAVIMRRIEQGRDIHHRFDELVARPSVRGSDLDGDDLATAWMHTSHVVTNAMTMAADNIRAVGDMLLPADRLVVPMYAHYPVIRSVLEAAAEAKWLLLPDERKERVTRTLRARYSDAGHDADLAKEERETVAAMDDSEATVADLAEAARHANERYARDIAKLRSISEVQQIPWSAVKSGLPPWIHMIKAVCGLEPVNGGIRVPGGYAAGLWKVMSGLSHPSTTRSVNHSTMDRLGSASDSGVFVARLSASLEWTGACMTVAWNTAQDALSLIDRRQTVRLLIP